MDIQFPNSQHRICSIDPTAQLQKYEKEEKSPKLSILDLKTLQKHHPFPPRKLR